MGGGYTIYKRPADGSGDWVRIPGLFAMATSGE